MTVKLSTSQLQLESIKNLTGILKMQAGTLNTKDNLVIVHNATDLGLIDKVEDGASTLGQVDYHRYKRFRKVVVPFNRLWCISFWGAGKRTDIA
ncbi:MAG: hypothetical protein U5K79_19195 [Cyclobacteriaceae bacterium]|nr:hypothetical protein [Cyclobacteriaceae bacterium]